MGSHHQPYQHSIFNSFIHDLHSFIDLRVQESVGYNGKVYCISMKNSDLNFKYNINERKTTNYEHRP